MHDEESDSVSCRYLCILPGRQRTHVVQQMSANLEHPLGNFRPPGIDGKQRGKKLDAVDGNARGKDLVKVLDKRLDSRKFSFLRDFTTIRSRAFPSDVDDICAGSDMVSGQSQCVFGVQGTVPGKRIIG